MQGGGRGEAAGRGSSESQCETYVEKAPLGTCRNGDAAQSSLPLWLDVIADPALDLV
jgi:hypothetical protein